MRWSTAMRREVVSTATAETVGRLDGVVVDPRSSHIAALVVGGRLVEWDSAGGIGTDAVTVTRPADEFRAPGSDEERRAVDGTTDPIAKPVITEHGFALGTLADLEFDPENGAIEQLILPDEEIAGSRLIGVGSYAVVVASDDPASTRDDLASLTKGELYELAQERDIDGRSTMTKQDLIRALS